MSLNVYLACQANSHLKIFVNDCTHDLWRIIFRQSIRSLLNSTSLLCFVLFVPVETHQITFRSSLRASPDLILRRTSLILRLEPHFRQPTSLPWRQITPARQISEIASQQMEQTKRHYLNDIRESLDLRQNWTKLWHPASRWSTWPGIERTWENHSMTIRWPRHHKRLGSMKVEMPPAWVRFSYSKLPVGSSEKYLPSDTLYMNLMKFFHTFSGTVQKAWWQRLEKLGRMKVVKKCVR